MLVGQITPHHVSICTLKAFASVGTDTLATQMQPTPHPSPYPGRGGWDSLRGLVGGSHVAAEEQLLQAPLIHKLPCLDADGGGQESTIRLVT